jgi:hypothetical protein
MIVTMAVVLCKLMVTQPTIMPESDCTAEEATVEEIVGDTDTMPELDFNYCQIRGQEIAADWKNKNPLYHSNKWRIARWRCAPGHYEIRGKA